MSCPGAIDDEVMKVEKIMTRDVVSVPADMLLKDVARLLITHRISGVPVCGSRGDVLGVVSEADILRKVEGFTKRYGVHRLVYFERYGDIQEAIAREKRLKRWCRDWKIELIETDNPRWGDLLPSLTERGSRIAPLARPG